MVENNNKENNENRQFYSDVFGISPIGAVIFTIVLTILMYLISKLIGYQ